MPALDPMLPTRGCFTVRTRRVVAGLSAAAIFAAVAGCDDGDDDMASGDGSEVTFLAGGGETDAGADPVASAEARIAGPVTDLAEAPDGGVWGIVDGTAVLCVTSGETSAVTPTLPDGAPAGELSDVAIGPDATVYVVLAEPQPGSPAVYALGEGGALSPRFGVAASEAELAAAAPVSPDGAAADTAPLGPIADLAVGDDGVVTFVEQVVPGGLSAANLVRRVVDGSLVTIAGGSPTPGQPPSDDDVIGSAFEEASTAREMPVLGVAHVAVDGSDTYLQVFNAVLRVDGDGGVTRILGSRDADAETLATSQGPFAESLPGVELDYRGNLDAGPSAADGTVLAMAIGAELTDDQVESFGWRLDGGSEHAAEVATAAASAAEQQGAVLVDADGSATIAALIGTDALLTSDGDVVAAGWDFDNGESVLVSYPVGG